MAPRTILGDLLSTGYTTKLYRSLLVRKLVSTVIVFLHQQNARTSEKAGLQCISTCDPWKNCQLILLLHGTVFHQWVHISFWNDEEYVYWSWHREKTNHSSWATGASALFQAHEPGKSFRNGLGMKGQQKDNNNKCQEFLPIHQIQQNLVYLTINCTENNYIGHQFLSSS